MSEAFTKFNSDLQRISHTVNDFKANDEDQYASVMQTFVDMAEYQASKVADMQTSITEKINQLRQTYAE